MGGVLHRTARQNVHDLRDNSHVIVHCTEDDRLEAVEVRIRAQLHLALPRAQLLPAARWRARAVARYEPQAHGDLRAVEELPGQRHHAVDEVGLDERLADPNEENS